MASSKESEQTFDIIIVGSGPSAIGCLCGLIEYYVETDRNKDLPFRIGVLEKGIGPPHDESSKDISNWFNTSHTPSSSCEIYTSTPQRHLHGRLIDIPCGKGLGGGTNVNAGLIRKPIWEYDFGKWPGRFHSKTNQMKDAILHLEQKLKDSNSFTEQKPCNTFLDICSGEMINSSKSTCTTSHPSVLHTCEMLERHSPRRTILAETSSSTNLQTFLRPANVAVAPTPPNASSSSSTSSYDGFHRVNYYDGLLSPLLSKYPNMKNKISFLNGIEVQRILFQDKVATGVECKNQGRVQDMKSTFVLHALKQVILCTGAIMSPVLLMVSGIGDTQQLQKAGITNIVQHLPSVGKNLRDHVLIPRSFLTNKQRDTQKSLNSCLGYYLLQEQARHDDSSDLDESMHFHETYHYELFLMDGQITSSVGPYFMAAALKRDISTLFTYFPRFLRKPVLSLSNLIFSITKLILQFLFTKIMDASDVTAGFNINILNPQSTGSVSIECQSNHSNKTPIDVSMLDIKIDPNYLSHPVDLYMLSQAWKSSDILAKHHFQASIETLPASFQTLYKGINALLFWKHNLDDSKNENTDIAPSWLAAYAKEFAAPYFHWCGTCQMGTKDPSVSEKKSVIEEEKNDIDESYVVTETLNVQGVHNLRICDASVFPSIVSCPTSLTCAGLGYVFGQFFADEIMKETAVKK